MKPRHIVDAKLTKVLGQHPRSVLVANQGLATRMTQVKFIVDKGPDHLIVSPKILHESIRQDLRRLGDERGINTMSPQMLRVRTVQAPKHAMMEVTDYGRYSMQYLTRCIEQSEVVTLRILRVDSSANALLSTLQAAKFTVIHYGFNYEADCTTIEVEK